MRALMTGEGLKEQFLPKVQAALGLEGGRPWQATGEGEWMVAPQDLKQQPASLLPSPSQHCNFTCWPTPLSATSTAAVPFCRVCALDSFPRFTWKPPPRVGVLPAPENIKKPISQSLMEKATPLHCLQNKAWASLCAGKGHKPSREASAPLAQRYVLTRRPEGRPYLFACNTTWVLVSFCPLAAG